MSPAAFQGESSFLSILIRRLGLSSVDAGPDSPDIAVVQRSGV